MNFSLRHVEVFWAVMTTGSATAAATLLNTSQPTISRELSRFEKLTQLNLFKRSGAKLVPTEEGLALFGEVQRSYKGLGSIRHAAQAIGQFRHGQLSVTCQPAFSQALLPRICQAFRVNFPGISVNITPQESPALEDSLTAQRYQLGLTENQLALPGTTIETVLTSDLVCVLPAGHALAAKQELGLRDFDGQDFVCLAPDDPYRVKVDQLFGQLDVERRTVVETHSAAAVCATVLLGVGVAILNPLTAIQFAGLGLHVRRLSCSIPYSVSVVRPLHRPESAGLVHFIDVIRETCRRINDQLDDISSAPVQAAGRT
jgi:DNA-binding transcriptional LysR family regulator